MLLTGLMVFLAAALLLIKLPRRLMLRAPHSPGQSRAAPDRQSLVAKVGEQTLACLVVRKSDGMPGEGYFASLRAEVGEEIFLSWFARMDLERVSEGGALLDLGLDLEDDLLEGRGARHAAFDGAGDGLHRREVPMTPLPVEEAPTLRQDEPVAEAVQLAVNRPSTVRTTVIDGQTIFFREAGDPAAPTILLLHGFPTSSHMYRELIPRLADIRQDHLNPVRRGTEYRTHLLNRAYFRKHVDRKGADPAARGGRLCACRGCDRARPPCCT